MRNTNHPLVDCSSFHRSLGPWSNSAYVIGGRDHGETRGRSKGVSWEIEADKRGSR
jgi:hypothetical protein